MRETFLTKLGQAANLKAFSESKERGKTILVDSHLSFVHEIQKCSQVIVADILENDDWVFGWMGCKHSLEIRAAG